MGRTGMTYGPSPSGPLGALRHELKQVLSVQVAVAFSSASGLCISRFAGALRHRSSRTRQPSPSIRPGDFCRNSA